MPRHVFVNRAVVPAGGRISTAAYLVPRAGRLACRADIDPIDLLNPAKEARIVIEVLRGGVWREEASARWRGTAAPLPLGRTDRNPALWIHWPDLVGQQMRVTVEAITDLTVGAEIAD